ncbi:DNA repair protein RecO [Erysipelothrix sp. HDW6C]|uniref:DNA repair protein RecO n=1 Tax=Erysipelothrix sp. HDW6C TaxID=2714930 RepID=UPI00140B3D80|nr:DNA repair protein RecO [Erysipelothrix sp. HDW6C]QIK70165.1 DNA repair protein RecO [Erysipelothrix sp. HDW6C]
MNNSDEGFVISTTPYREHDCMVHFLGKEYGLIRFVLPGYYKPKSKQGSLGLEFSQVRYRFNFQENRLNRILNGELIEGYLHQRTDLEWLMMMSLASEITVRTYDPSAHFYFYDHIALLFSSNNLMKAMIEFIVGIIKHQGFTPDISGCVVCGSQHINTFSIERGGYLCTMHSPAYVKDSKELLLAMKGLFIGAEIDAFLETIELTPVLERLVKYLEYHGDYRFNSWKLISGM